MTRLLVVEPSYCPYQAGFSSAATAVSEVIEGESQILKPFGTPRIADEQKILAQYTAGRAFGCIRPEQKCMVERVQPTESSIV